MFIKPMENGDLERIAARLLLATENPIKFPVDLDKIAAILHTRILKTNLAGESGYIIAFRGRYLICIDAENNRITHNRFTVAHELSHVVLGHLDRRRALPEKEKEREANYLASALLMPFHFMVAYRDYEERILSGFMAVSEQAMEIRRREIKKDPEYHKAVARSYYADHLDRDLRGSI